MRLQPDFHVEKLNYKIQENDTVIYNNPSEVKYTGQDADFVLSDGRLTCTMLTHFATEKAARDVIEPILRSWEVQTDLERGKGELLFEFVNSDIIDRTVYPEGEKHLYANSTAIVTMAGTARMQVGRTKYPDPPSHFRFNPDAESIWYRYNGYKNGKEPLLSMGYFCYTFVATLGGGSYKLAAKKLNIDRKILNKLSELTSDRGDLLTARKISPKLSQPLTGQEAAWIEVVIKMIILRVGDTRDLNSLPQVNMNDLPSII